MIRSWVDVTADWRSYEFLEKSRSRSFQLYEPNVIIQGVYK